MATCNLVNIGSGISLVHGGITLNGLVERQLSLGRALYVSFVDKINSSVLFIQNNEKRL